MRTLTKESYFCSLKQIVNSKQKIERKRLSIKYKYSPIIRVNLFDSGAAKRRRVFLENRLTV